MLTFIKKTSNNQQNTLRLHIILDIGTKAIREHIQHFLNLNNYSNSSELIEDKSLVSERMYQKLKKGCFQSIPTSLDLYDISKSFALIDVVINELNKKSSFKYDNNKYGYCKQLKEIRNKFSHKSDIETDDVAFSTTVATIEEIIRQLCDFDNKISQNYLDKVEVQLEKGSSEVNLVSNLPSRPSTSKLYTRSNETDLFDKITSSKYKMSCIAGMAGVGKSTLATMYGYHRKDNHQAKVCFC